MLTCVFVRFLEDNALLDAPLISGPAAGHKQGGLQQAKDRLTVYFNDHPIHAEREYLQDLFAELEQLPTMAELLDHAHNPLWQLPLSADGARLLIDFFQRLDPKTGEIVHDFADPQWDTRFLGDLYQDLSESVRKRYALLQTPEFVEAFILDYTLEPAKAAFGLPGLRMIDPTCGSGHFLLTSFERLFDDWVKREPATNSRALAQRALDAIHGVDINPYAVAIARFRLLIAAMKAAGSDKIKNAPDFHFNLAVGDSLLLGPRHESQGQGIQAELMDDALAHVFEVEDKAKLERVLGQRYHVVVGNPPYITVKDKALNQAYRDKYLTCHRQYSLGVPFTERFFDLTLSAVKNHPAGFMGMITANSFMKREFGKKLIQDYLPKKELTHVIDTSGAYIPGHGTPTVILFARNQRPQSEQVRAVLGIRGEPGTPEDAAQGKVWQSIVDLLEKPGSENEYVSVVDQQHDPYASHPWSVGGGGVTELKELLDDRSTTQLRDQSHAIGFVCITKQDDVFVQQASVLDRHGVKRSERRRFGIGEEVRDWGHVSPLDVLFPYENDLETRKPADFSTAMRFMWPYREDLYSRKVFGGQTYREAGKSWYEFGQIPVERFKIPYSIAFAFVATHNHFVLDRGGKVFNRTAPVIKLPAAATEADHLALMGLLNSSTACFWMKNVFYSRGEGGGTRVEAGNSALGDEAWKSHFEFAGTGLKSFPIAASSDISPFDLSQTLNLLSRDQAKLDPEHVLAANPEQAEAALAAAKSEADSLWRQMIALQEELDWLNYRLYGLIGEDLCYGAALPEIQLGERPFEIQLARRVAAGEQTTWFERHGSIPITVIPDHWPEDYRALTERRLQAIQDNRWIKLIEQPEYKRRWNREPWEKRQERALKDWLLDHLEGHCRAAELRTCAQLADRTRHDNAFQQVAALYTGSDTFDAQALVGDLVAADNVPQMASARYKPKAMPKFRAWQETWDKQRAEDAIDARTELDPSDAGYLTAEQAKALKAKQIGDIPLPPKYASADFRRPSYWPLRGKLDVSKERFFSLPHCEKEGDSTLVIGWAGLNHLQRAQAIAGWYLERKELEGWDAQRLKPMLAALDELIPWLKQWYNEIDPEYGERLGNYYEGFLLEELRQLELSRDGLPAWEPPVARRSRRRKGVTRGPEGAKKN